MEAQFSQCIESLIEVSLRRDLIKESLGLVASLARGTEDFILLSDGVEYDRTDRFPFGYLKQTEFGLVPNRTIPALFPYDYEPNGVPFGS